MKASCNWLTELTGIDATPTEMAERLTRAGLEVEGTQRFGLGLEGVVIAEVRSKKRHPTKDKLTLVRVSNGQDEVEVVCGAPNVPDPGARVALVKVGATLPGGMSIGVREVAGVVSHGMLASEKELGIGHDGDGILVMEGTPKVGAPIASALGLEDTVLEINVTPNRPDALGHLGIARELAVLFGAPFTPRLREVPARMLSELQPPPPGNDGLPLLGGTGSPAETISMIAPSAGVPLTIPIEIDDASRCPRYLGLVLHRARAKPAPFWMRYRLFVLGQRSIDALVDATNWVLLETGHPIHAFDLAKLRGGRVIVRLAKDGEVLRTLDGVDRKLSADDLVIADVEGPIALAGVMGGAHSGVSDTTEHILLEAAWFDPRSVRRTSRRHGLHTEASHRFERGADPSVLPLVARRAATVLAQVSDAGPSPCIVDAHPRRITPSSIEVRPAFFETFLGDEVPENEARRILEALGCAVSPGEREGWRVTAPLHRPDLTRPEDLAEEVARVRGYDRIPSLLFAPLPDGRPRPKRPALLRTLRRGAMAAGLYEAVSFTFLALGDLEKARASREVITLANPLSEERSVMRTSLLPGLLAAASRSERHQSARVRLFELARVYAPAKPEGEHAVPVRESARLAVLLSGPRDAQLGEPGAVDFYDGKGALEVVLGTLGLSLTTQRDAGLAADAPALHPRASARVLVDGEPVGVLGELHPDVQDAHGLTARPVYAELDVDALVRLAQARGPSAVLELPKFPKVQRDLAVIVAESVEAAQVADVIVRAASGLAEDVTVFDVYRGKPIAEGQKSLAFRISYRDREATLTDARVDATHAAVLAAAESSFGARLRA
jgi:phenylalanyl-tRNA synthetase beta chain